MPLYETTLVRPYCTLEDVQEITGNDDPDSVERLLRAINSASRMVEDECSRDFWFHDHATEGLKIEKAAVIGTTVFLPFPVLTLTEVTIDGEVADLEAIEFVVGEPYLKQSTSWGSYPFTSVMILKGTFGYELPAPVVDTMLAPPTNIPESIRRSTSLIAAAFSGLWNRERIGQDGSRDSMLETRVPSEVATLLRKWKRKGRLVNF